MDRLSWFKTRFLAAWKATPLMPLKERREMALEQALGEDGILRQAWEATRATSPGMESGAADGELLHLGRQMAGFLGATTRTAKRTTNNTNKPNGQRPGATHEKNVHRTKGDGRCGNGSVEGLFRKACKYGFVPTLEWWRDVLGLDVHELSGLLKKAEDEGWAFKGVSFGMQAKLDERQGQIIKLERQMQALQKQLEGLKNGG